MKRPPSRPCAVDGHDELCSAMFKGDLAIHGHGTPKKITSVWWQRPSGEMVRIDQGFDAILDLLEAMRHVETAMEMDAWCKVRGLI